MEAIDGLAEAIKGYNGGLVLVSHDFRLIDQARPSTPASGVAPADGVSNL